MKWYKQKQEDIHDIYDIDSYLQLPKKQQLLWGLFYIHPRALRFDSVEDFYKDGKFETPFDRYFKKEYPVQFFFRETIPDVWRRFWWPIERTKRKVDEYFFPRQKWLYKKIPNYWVDKDYLIMTTIFESVIHYVEVEKCFEVIEWGSDDYHKEVEAKLKRIYRWAKLRKKVEDRHENCNSFFGLYESILYKYDKHFAKETIDISDQLWT